MAQRSVQRTDLSWTAKASLTPTPELKSIIEPSGDRNKPSHGVGRLSPVHCTTLAATFSPGCAPDPGFSGHAERNRNQAPRQPRNPRRPARAPVTEKTQQKWLGTP